MADKSRIEWTDATWNPVTGCTKVSAGCANCYAETWAGRQMGPWKGRKFNDVRVHPERLDWPLHRRKPLKIFVNSMSDLFHEKVPFDFVDRVMAAVSFTPRHTYQIVTKRPQRMHDYFAEDRRGYIEGRAKAMNSQRGGPDLTGKGINVWPLPHVWLGVSVENQATADHRIPFLLETPAAIRFLSCEPLLGPVDLRPWVKLVPYGDCAGCTYDKEEGTHSGGTTQHPSDERIDWVIAGGESGSKARPAHPDWFRSLRNQCEAAAVPFFFKQHGEWHECPVGEWNGLGPFSRPPQTVISPQGETSGGFLGGLAERRKAEGWKALTRIGKKHAGRLLDGREWSEFPRVST